MAYPFGATPVSGFSRAKSAARRQFDRGRGEAAKRLEKKSVPLSVAAHDLRRTGVAKLAAIGIDRIVADKLAHKGGKLHGVAAVYQRHDFAKEQAATLEALGAHVETGSIATGVLKRAEANRNLQEVARLIAGSLPPSWLVRYLAHFISDVRGAREWHERIPKRAELRRDLDEVIRLAKRLATLLDQNSHAYGEVMRGNSPSIESPSALPLDIADRAQIQLAADRSGGGRDRAVPMIHGRRFKRTRHYSCQQRFAAPLMSQGLALSSRKSARDGEQNCLGSL